MRGGIRGTLMEEEVREGRGGGIRDQMEGGDGEMDTIRKICFIHSTVTGGKRQQIKRMVTRH